MMSTTYEIDPNGDIELVLRGPNTQKIIPALPSVSDRTNEGDSDESDDESNESDSEFDNPPCEGRYTIFSKFYSTDEGKPSLTDSEVRMRVSSRHLTLASRTFRAMLEGPWSEATSSSQPLRQIRTAGWDVMALSIVLDIVHGRHRGVPNAMNVGLLARIATIIDYYEFHEAVHVYGNKWLRKARSLEKPFVEIGKRTLLWMFISRTFSDKTRFGGILLLYLNKGRALSQIDTFELPLAGLLETLEENRIAAIQYIIKRLGFVRRLLCEEKECPLGHEPGCSSLTLGALIRGCHSRNIPDADGWPFCDYSIAVIKKEINSIKVATPLYSNRGSRCHGHRSNLDSCDIEGRMQATFASIESFIAGCVTKLQDRGTGSVKGQD